jgi:hypothetical protein
VDRRVGRGRGRVNVRATSFQGSQLRGTQLAWCAWFLTNL